MGFQVKKIIDVIADEDNCFLEFIKKLDQEDFGELENETYLVKKMNKILEIYNNGENF